MLYITKNNNTRYVIRASIIAAIYTITTYIFAPISYGPLQFRISEALTVLPMLFPEAIPGLFVGTMLANLLGGLGLWDVIGGSIVTLFASTITYIYRHSVVAYLAPIFLNAFLISIYLAIIFQVPYWLTVLYIGISEAIIVILLGYPLFKVLARYIYGKN